MKGWSPPCRLAWSLEGQAVAMGLEPPTVTRESWHFLRECLMVHLCARNDCRECAEARRIGLRTLRVTRDEIEDGRALEKVGAATWRKAEGGLF